MFDYPVSGGDVIVEIAWQYDRGRRDLSQAFSIISAGFG